MDAQIDVTNIRIETERLILRFWKESDAEDFYEYAKVDGVGQMAGWKPHESVEESRNIIRMFMDGKHTFALVYKENGKVIGSVGLDELRDLDSSFDALQGREVGYGLNKEYWGRGLMPEAVKAVIHYCFEVLTVDFLTICHFLWNDQSRRVIEKCGFQYMKETNFHTEVNTVEPAKLYIMYNPCKER